MQLGLCTFQLLSETDMKTFYSMVIAALLMVAGAASTAEPVSLEAMAAFESASSPGVTPLAGPEMVETAAGGCPSWLPPDFCW